MFEAHDLSPHASDATAGHALMGAAEWQTLASCLHLCPRELQIVQLVFDDQKEQTIARTLGISPHTVNTYMQRLYHKVQVCSRPQLILRVMEAHFALAAGFQTHRSASVAGSIDTDATRALDSSHVQPDCRQQRPHTPH
jgi:DNA-binding CsgD family transcriptional regulator